MTSVENSGWTRWTSVSASARKYHAAVRVAFPVGKLHAGDGAPFFVRARHQPAGAEHLVVGMRRDDEQACARRDRQRGRRWRRTLRRHALLLWRGGQAGGEETDGR